MNEKHIVLIGDIQKSRVINNRAEFQSRLEACLHGLNLKNIESITSPYTITLGDEFQAVYKSAKGLFTNLMEIEAEFLPVRFRFSIALGEITTKISHTTAIGMDGPAFHLARDQMEKLKKKDERYSIAGVDHLIQISLQLYALQTRSWKQNRFHLFKMYRQEKSIQEMAEKLKLTERSVFKNIREGSFEKLGNYLNELEYTLSEKYL